MTWRGSAGAYLTTQVAHEARFVTVVNCSVGLTLVRTRVKSTTGAAKYCARRVLDVEWEGGSSLEGNSQYEQKGQPSTRKPMQVFEVV